MLSNFTIKTKLHLFLIISLLGLALASGAGYLGMRAASSGFDEVADNRLPSLVGLYQMKLGNRGIRIAGATVFRYREDPTAQSKIAALVAAFKSGFEEIDAGRRIYDPLPQSKEEEVLWKEYLTTWELRKKGGERLMGVAEQLSKARDPVEYKQHFEEYEKANANVLPLVEAMRVSLDKVVDLNVKLAADGTKDARQQMETSKKWMLIVCGACFIGLIGLGLGINSSILIPLNAMRQTMTTMSESYDFRQRSVVDGKDEIAQTALAFNSLIGTIQTSLSSTLEQMKEVRQEVAHLNGAAREVASASVQQASSAASMAAAVEEMTVSINHVSDRAGDALTLSNTAETQTTEGNAIISKTASGMSEISLAVQTASVSVGELGRRSEEISKVVQVIKDVADQTNLLALNAAIEAARAGEQGRGFAVVADEVRKLAERTAMSTAEIARVIDEIQKNSHVAVDNMNTVVAQVSEGQTRTSATGEKMAAIASEIKQLAGAIQDISYALKEQSAASNDIAKNVESVAQMTDENNAATERTAESAARVDQFAEKVLSTISRFKV